MLHRHSAIPPCSRRLRPRRSWVDAGLGVLAVLAILTSTTGARAADPAMPAPPGPLVAGLDDPELFRLLGSSGETNAGWLDTLRTEPCIDGTRLTGSIACQAFASHPMPLEHASFKRLLRILPRCTWVREGEGARTRPILNWGVAFRGRRVSVDLGLELDSMALYMFAPGERPVRGIMPEALKPELASVVAGSDTDSSLADTAREKLIRRWGRAIEIAPSPCDDGTNQEPEFIYYEQPPELVTRVEPVRPDLRNVTDRRVVLHVRVQATGRPCATKVIRGDPILAKAAVQAVEQWIWKPATSNEKPVPVWIEVPIDF